MKAIDIGPERIKRTLFERVAAARSEDIAANIGRWLDFAGCTPGETWFELQALGVPTNRNFEETRHAHARSVTEAAVLLAQAEKFNAPGVYIIANQINPAVTARDNSRNAWLTAKKGVSTTDLDIAARTVLYIDIDAKRTKGTSSTDEEKAGAQEATGLIIARLCRTLPVRSIGLGDSGNGFGVYVALNALPVTSEVEQVVRGILAALDVLYTTDRAEVDRSVSDAKRLCPAFGTTKRKGAKDIPERPHRRTAFACGVTVDRLEIENLRMLLDSLMVDLPEARRAEVESAMTGKRAIARATLPTYTGDSPFEHAKTLDPLSVMTWLGLIDGDGNPKCPGCGEVAGTKIIGTGFKCSHNRCAAKGVRDGYRTAVDLVMESRSVESTEAVNMLAEHFGFEGVRAKGQAQALRQRDPRTPTYEGAPEPPEAFNYAETGDAGADAEPVDPSRFAPIKLDPLETLRQAGALIGHAELCAATATPPVSIWFDGVLEDSHVEIAGPSGHGKSTLSALLLCARANPTPRPVKVLGVPVTPAPEGRYVVTVQEENGVFSWRQKCEAACQALGLPVSQTLDRVIFMVRRNVFAGDAKWQAILALGLAGLVGAVFVDSRARVLRGAGESNMEDAQAAMAEQCFGLVNACGAPLFVVSHTRKGKDGAGPSDIEDVSGSLQRGASADVLMLVTATKDDAGRVESATVKFAKLRNAVRVEHPAPVSFRLEVDMDGRWALDTSAPQLVSRDVRALPVRVRELLAEHPGGLTKTRIRDLLHASSDNVEKAISALFEQRAVTKAQALGPGGRPQFVFILRPTYDGGRDDN